jgi:glutathione S-transferase
MSSLNDRLLAAYAAGDHWSLVELYATAAEQAGSIDETCYFLTFAYVYGLEQNHPATAQIYDRLKAEGRV